MLEMLADMLLVWNHKAPVEDQLLIGLATTMESKGPRRSNSPNVPI
jgi:hypothetical protein